MTNKQYVDAQVATRLTQAQGDARYAAIADKYPGNAAINTLINAQSYTKAQTDAKYQLATANHDMPSGGTAGQVLAKISGTDYATHWITPVAAPSGPGPTSGLTQAQVDARVTAVGNPIYAPISSTYTKTQADNRFAAKTALGDT